MNQLFIQPSFMGSAAAMVAGQAYRGIPVPGVGNIPPVAGIADCRNLLSDSPPTMLELYELYSYSIAFGVYVANSGVFATPPAVTVELALLVSDRVAYITQQELQTVSAFGGIQGRASGAWVSDLVNPIRLGSRERLSLRIGLTSDSADDSGWGVTVGARYDVTTGNPIGDESTISYNTIMQPASRQL